MFWQVHLIIVDVLTGRIYCSLLMKSGRFPSKCTALKSLYNSLSWRKPVIWNLIILACTVLANKWYFPIILACTVLANKWYFPSFATTDQAFELSEAQYWGHHGRGCPLNNLQETPIFNILPASLLPHALVLWTGQPGWKEQPVAENLSRKEKTGIWKLNWIIKRFCTYMEFSNITHCCLWEIIGIHTQMCARTVRISWKHSKRNQCLAY